ncbi:Uncharacterised protein [Citrobacter amalonaticus]|nr:Uncharacterised protein [Citrobacter amalonaticus]
MRKKRKLTQQRQNVLSRLVSLCQYRSTCLLQDLRTRHVRHFSRVVSVFDTATSRRQVVNGVAQVGDSRIETVLYRTQGSYAVCQL